MSENGQGQYAFGHWFIFKISSKKKFKNFKTSLT
jgi:hypothetical protein